MAGPRYVAAIDQGTTSTRCILFDRQGRLVSVAQREHRQYFPQPGWVEHDAVEIWRIVKRVLTDAIRSVGADARSVVSLGISNQRETTVMWDRRTGVPVQRAIGWQDTRSESLLHRLATPANIETVLAISGLKTDAYFAGPRIAWLLERYPGLRADAERGDIICGSMDSWLIWNLTGGVDGGLHVTDVTNASRSMLMNIRTLEWSDELLRMLDVPVAMLPEIRSCIGSFGRTTTVVPGIAISAVLGDQQAALFGHTCFQPGEAKCTLGSGSFLLLNTGTTPVTSTHGLLTTIGYQIEQESPVYALEGSIAMTGSLVQWLRDGLGLIQTASEVETLALTVPDNGGCHIVPAFAGLFAPHWEPDARGIIDGLTSYITKGHIARAALESTAWQVREVLDAMNADSGVDLLSLRVDGGMTANNLLMQILSDVLDLDVLRPMVSETVSLGAAYAAGLSVGFWTDTEELVRNHHRAGEWHPRSSGPDREREYAAWKRSVRRTLVPP